MMMPALLRQSFGRKERPLTDILDDAEFWADLREYATGKMLPVFEAVYLGGVEIGLRMVEMAERKRARSGTKAAGDDLPDRITRRATLEAARLTDTWWNSIAETSRNQLAGVLRASGNREIALGQAVDYLEGAFGPARARRIAVTETNRIVGAAAQDTYSELGIGKWGWRTAADGRVDAVCSQRQTAGPYSMDERFEPAHVSCRCWPIPVIEDEDEVATELPPDEAETTPPPLHEEAPDFKTVKAAEAWLTERHPTIYWDFKGLGVPVLAPTANRLNALLNAYPGVRDRLKYIGTYRDKLIVERALSRYQALRKRHFGSGEIAHASRGGTYMGLNPKYFTKMEALDAVEARAVTSGHFRPYDRVRFRPTDHTVTHEFGHLIDSWLNDLGQGGNDRFSAGWYEYRRRHVVYRRSEEISGYAKASDFEHVAELYSAHVVGDGSAVGNAGFDRFQRVMALVDERARLGGVLENDPRLTELGERLLAIALEDV